MKRFAQIFLLCLIGMMVFFFFGGPLLFDPNQHYWLSALLFSVLAAILADTVAGQNEKIRALEQRIQALEEKAQ